MRVTICLSKSRFGAELGGVEASRVAIDNEVIVAYTPGKRASVEIVLVIVTKRMKAMKPTRERKES